MKLKIFIFAVSLFLLPFAVGKAWSDEVSVDRTQSLMHPDAETMLKLQQDYENAPKATADPVVAGWLASASTQNASTSLSLLSHVPYLGPLRNQGACGNCWVWAATGLTEIALSVQNGVSKQLSTQFLDSCDTIYFDGGPFSCDTGGNLNYFAAFYSALAKAVPWSNTNASYADGNGYTSVSCSSLSTAPNYPITSISPQTITTTGVGQAAAISNIKNILNQNKGVAFSFWMVTYADWAAFYSFWDNSADSVLWNPDASCGETYDGGEGGHEVAIVGYNDDDPNPANHYWIVLNSWGTTTGRPTGLFEMPMQMNYDCTVNWPGYPDMLAKQFQALDIGFNIGSFTMSGTVYSGTEAAPGPALAGATVSIAGKTATTSSTGTFTITALPAGTQTLTISKTGYTTYSNSSYMVSGSQSGLGFYLDPACSMSGTVHSGSVTGPALAGATVSIAGKTATTSSTGTFTITAIPAGTYTLTISKTGYTTYTYSSYVISGNQSALNFDLPLITYSMSGTVYSGTVSAPGPALTGATVSIAGQTATTSSTGTFTIAAIPAGTYALTVSKAGYATYSISSDVISGNQSGLNFYLDPACSMSGTVHSGSVTGPALAGATVSIAGKTATTSSTGAFTIAAIPAGTYTLTILKAGYATYTNSSYVISANQSALNFDLTPITMSGTLYSGTVSAPGSALAGATVSIAGLTATTSSTGTFTVTAIPLGTYTLAISKAGYVTYSNSSYVISGNQSGLNFYLDPTYSMSGTVHSGSVTGPALAGATVSIAGKTATTSSTGTFTIAAIPAGTTTLTISKAGYATYSNSSYVISGNQTGLNFDLIPITMSGTLYSGTVSAPGPALAGATVSIAGLTATTSSTGTFTVTAIPVGSQTLTISKTGYKAYSNSPYVISGSQSGLSFYLDPTYSMGGTVHSGSFTGPALPGATVSVADASGNHAIATTSSTGAFTITAIPAGTTTLTISKAGYATYSNSSYVISANQTGLNFDLIPITMSGTLYSGTESAPGPALAGATVSIAGLTTTTSSTGTFTITAIPLGTYTLTISRTGYATYTSSSYVISGNQSGLSFYLDPTYSMSGTVHSGSVTGPALAGATVSIAGKTATTSSTGAFTIAAIPAGTQTLTISKAGYMTYTDSSYVISGNQSALNFDLIPITMSGTVYSGSVGGPVLSGATVSIAGLTTTTSSTGTFTLTAIPVGTQTLKISKAGYTTYTNPSYVVSGSESGLIFYLINPVTVIPLPNLTPYQPFGWSDKIVVSKTTGTNTDSSPLYTTDTLYVDWAVINNGTAGTWSTFYTDLYVDGVLRQSWYTNAPLSPNWYAYVTDYSIGSLSAGTHTFEIVVDATDAIIESNKSDNEYAKTITVYLPPSASPAGATAGSSPVVPKTIISLPTTGTGKAAQ